MTKSDFFKDPLRKLAENASAPKPWVREAWASNANSFRDHVTEELGRWVSKYATMRGHENWTSLLSEALSSEQLANLYIDIRDRSRRLEFEWRPEFIRIFPKAATLLPHQDEGSVRDYYCAVLYGAISANDSVALMETITEMNQHGLRLEQLTLTVDDLSKCGLPVPGPPGEVGSAAVVVGAVEYARRLGYLDMAAELAKHVNSPGG